MRCGSTVGRGLGMEIVALNRPFLARSGRANNAPSFVLCQRLGLVPLLFPLFLSIYPAQRLPYSLSLGRGSRHMI